MTLQVMDRGRLSSDSSSWSLVDVDDSDSDSSVDVSIANNLVVESVDDSDSEQEDISEDEVVAVADEALEVDELEEEEEYDEDDDESDIEPVVESDDEFSGENVVEEEVDVSIVDDYDSENEQIQEEEQSESELEQDDDESVASEDDEEEEEEDERENSLEVLEDEEIMAEAAAMHFVEPTKVVQKFDELSEFVDSPFDKVLKHFIPQESKRSTTFAVVVLATLIGAVLGQYIGSCLIGDFPLTVNDGLYCLASDKVLFDAEPAGLQYQQVSLATDAQNNFESEAEVEDVELATCKEKLDDAKAEVKMKQGVNRFVREMYKKQLAQAKQVFEARLSLYKRAARRLHVQQQSMKLPSNVSNATTESNSVDDKTSRFCSLVERKVFNFTRSIFNKISNFELQPSLVNHSMSFFPKFDKPFEKVSSWWKNSKAFKQLPKLPNLSTKMFANVPRKVKDFFKTLTAKKALTTALAKTNLSTMVAQYNQTPLFKNLKKNIQSAFNKISVSAYSVSKMATDVCFAPKTSSAAEKLIKLLIKDAEFINKIGQKQFAQYVTFLKSLSDKNSSKQLECERDWWLGCGPQFLQNCELQQWQLKRWFSGPAFINRKQGFKQNLVEMGWIEAKERRTRVKCPKLASTPLPCPVSKPLPSLEDEPLAPCHPGPNSARPCQSATASESRPCSQKLPKFVKPKGDGRPDWFTQRAAVRAEQRSAKEPSAASGSNWFIQRAKARAQQRSAHKKSSTPPQKSAKKAKQQKKTRV